jgi:HEAT repeat protein
VKKISSAKILGYSGIVVVCVLLLYFLTPTDANKPPSLQAGKPKAESTASTPLAKPLPQKPKQSAQPQEKASGSVIAKAEAALEDPDITNRVQAVLSLRTEFTAEAVALLGRFLNDQERAVVTAAIDALGVIGLETANEVLKKQALDLLLEKTKDKDFASRGPALITAAMFGEDERTLQLIGGFIAEEGDEGKEIAVRALAFQKGPVILPYLSEIMIKSKNAETRRNASALLAELGTPEALALLSQGLDSRREGDQLNSAWALSLRNDYASNAKLIEAVGSRKLSEASIAAIATSSAAPAVFEGVFDLNISLEDQLFMLDVISEYTKNATGEIRNAMAEVIKPMLRSENPDLKLAAIKAMGKLGAKTDQSGALAGEFDSPSLTVRGAALEAFMPYCTPSTYKALIKLWYDENEQIRRTAFMLSEVFMNDSDLPELQKATTHKDPFIARHSGLMIKHLDKGVL